MIYRASQNNLDEIYSLLNNSAETIPDFDNFKLSYGKMIADTDNVVLVYQEETVLGMIHLKFDHFKQKSKRTAEIVDMLIDRNCCFKYVVQTLVQAAEHVVKSNQCNIIKRKHPYITF